MELIEDPPSWRALLAERRQGGDKVGLVPTMGALHEGHLSLVAAAKQRAGFVTLSIFVNPLQFDDEKDLAKYPRPFEADLAAAEGAGVDAVFAPSRDDMYPGARPATVVDPGPLGDVLEGASRPGHFEGVATVLTKLFSLAGTCRAFFGEKDFQQLAIVRQVVADLDLDVEVVGCPTVREPDGLALSSRNSRLSPSERSAATCLHRALQTGARSLSVGEDPTEAESAMAAVIEDEPLAELDYAVVREESRLGPPTGGPGESLRLLVAARVGPVRLIDNIPAD